jgi:hypothetical protein
VAGVVEMEIVRSGEGDDPEANHETAHGEDPFADGAIMGGEFGGFADSEDLAAEANGHENDADSECEPGHGVAFVP